MIDTTNLINTKSNESDEIPLNFRSDYKVLLTQLKDKVRSARTRAALAVNSEVIELYWHIGKQIIERKDWGSKLINSLSRDLQNNFPETRGFSVRNLQRMRQFSDLYPDFQIVSQTATQLPWGHIIVLIHAVKEPCVRDWYARKAVEQEWPRSELERHIKEKLCQRQAVSGSKTSNYLTRLPCPQASYAQELLKQPYNFDFLGLHDEALEREIEHASTEHITKFLLELGKGFAFVGRQVPVCLEGSEYFIDMLFYHLKLHAYVVVELKATKFKPEHSGKLNFYLNLVDDFLKMPEDKPSIGLLLRKSANKFEAEYALKGIEKPIGISEYELTKAIPENMKCSLPSIEEVEAELNEITKND